jgi:hypothetical protein
LSTAKEAIRRFDKAGTPWLRPVDYYAEMVKTDQHMAKVKEQLMNRSKSSSRKRGDTNFVIRDWIPLDLTQIYVKTSCHIPPSDKS